jgi:ubiquinone/menaquinone biosynthesis C-methylase UbiE
MKEVDGVKYYNIPEIYGMLHNRISQDEIRQHFQTGRIHGIKIEDKWHAKKEVIDEFEEEVIHENIYFSELHNINLTKIQLNGRILDIGGGGEGVIGQFAGVHVIAIDPSERELKEAPGDCLKIIMNAKDLKFLDETFDTITVFFTMMYIPMSDHKQVFKEIYRVLKPKGETFLWDLKIPERPETEKEIYAIKLKVDIGDKKISTGYGTKWGKKFDMEHYLDLGESVGFKVTEKEINGETFFIKFRKD